MPPASSGVIITIPAFNASAYIGQAISSCLAQDYPDLRILVINNRSTDGTGDIARSFKDSRLAVLDNDRHLSMQDNWNRCLEFAGGSRYFKMLCADDLLEPDCIRLQAGELDRFADKNAVMCACARSIVDGNGKEIMHRSYSWQTGTVIDGRLAVRISVRHGTNLFGEPASILLRSDTLPGLSFDASAPYMIDMDLWAKALLRGNFVYLNKTLARFRVSRHSASVGMATSQREHFNAFAKKLHDSGAYGLTRGDMLLSRARSRLNAILRYLFYKFTSK